MTTPEGRRTVVIVDDETQDLASAAAAPAVSGTSSIDRPSTV